MAHRVTAPALQRAQRLLHQWIRPGITTNAIPFEVESTAEMFEPAPYETAVHMERSPFTVGSRWGRPWHTVWFKMTAIVPEQMANRPLVACVDLGFSGRGDGFQVEGMAWSDGHRVQAVQPDRRMVPLGCRAAGEIVDVWIEAAATPIIAGHSFGYAPTPLGDPRTAGEAPLYVLKRADLAVHHRAVEELDVIVHSMIDLVIDLDETSAQRARLFDLLEHLGHVIDVRDVAGSAERAVEFVRTRTRPWSASTSHTIAAVGHAHLDTGWLWPIRETRRKAVRTFTNAVRLLEQNPTAVFCHSQAQHYDWVREDAPEIFEKVSRLVESGRWEPIGGMWVETDLNLPSGESLIRQFVLGRQAFASWFGDSVAQRCGSGGFLPDDFGYPGNVPQIVRHCGGRWFFSQKMSWNESNRFPHHTFWWEGIDGSRVFTHFSPVETYNAIVTPSQVRFAERNFSDHLGASQSLLLYGHGDGGGGPTQQMIDRVERTSWWSELPEVHFDTVAGFFERAESEYGLDAPTWVGEMYLEKHRGTYSSQIGTKWGNRRCERLMSELEMWTVCRARDGESSAAERTALWRRILTQQFHDILPGSSIAWVHDDAEREHASIADSINVRIDDVFGARSIESDRCERTDRPVIAVANPSSVARSGVEWISGEPHWVDLPAMSITEWSPNLKRPADVEPVSVSSLGDGSVVVSNGLVRVSVGSDGSIHDIVDLTSSRSIAPSGTCAGLRLVRDRPAEYDAWDIDRADADVPADLLVANGPPVVAEHCDLAATVRIRFTAGTSEFTLSITVRAGHRTLDFGLEAEWHERETRLQFVLPVDVMAREALCGIQFGHVRRPRHANTSWDAARFEVCAHRYVHVAEPGFGVALLAAGPRGYDIRGDSLRLTVLRSPSFPDPNCDEGHRTVDWGVRVDAGSGDLGSLEEECDLRQRPIRVILEPCDPLSAPIRCEIPGVLVSALKPADDRSGDVILRLWETRGARSRGTAHVSGFTSIERVDGLERSTGQPEWQCDAEGRVEVSMRPFEIVTLRLHAKR